MALNIYFGSTSQSLDLFIQDSTSTTGAGKTGLVYNTVGLSLWYRIGATGTLTQITLVSQTLAGAWTSGGFVEIDSTNGPGLYRVDLPNAVLAASGLVTLYLKGTGVVMAPREIDTRPINTVTNLTNYPTGDFSSTQKASITAAVPTAAVIAAQVRTELTVELANLDATVSSRLATSGYTAPVTAAAVRTEMDANSTKLANLDATVSSRLATSGYTAPTTPPTVGAIRAEMDSNSTKLALLDAAISTRAATGAAMTLTSGERTSVAGVIEAEFLNDMTGAAFMSGVISQITALFDSGADVPIVTIAAAVADQVAYTLLANPTYKLVTNASGQVTVSNTIPTAAQNATQVRTELTAELGRLDATVSSRLATSGYTTPPTVAAVRTEMDANSTQLANLDATVSSRLATSGYTAPTTPPTVGAIRAEMDSNSAKLAAIEADTSIAEMAASQLLGVGGDVGDELRSFLGMTSPDLDAQLKYISDNGPITTRSLADTQALEFTWPTPSLTLTGLVSINGGAFQATAGAITYLRAESDQYFYRLAFHAADRPTLEGTARYIFSNSGEHVHLQLRVEAPLTAVAIRQEIDTNSTQLALIPKQGQTHRFRQVAAVEGDKTADVAIEAAT